MLENNDTFMDKNRIIVHLRDINGRRFHLVWENVIEFQNFDWSSYDDRNYEILLVEWGNHCIYSGLASMYGREIYLEDLIAYFA